MDPSESREQTLQALQEAIVKMTTSAWDLALLGQPAGVAEQAKAERRRLNLARTALENAQLADIRDQLQANDDDLASGRQRLAGALEDIQQVQAVLGAVSSILGVVGRVVALAG